MPKRNEVKTYFGRCRCCLEYGYLKNLWTEQPLDGNIEIFGEMIIQCFSLALEVPYSTENDHICDDCVSKLKDAVTFRNRILVSQKILTQEAGLEPTSDDEINIKAEDVNIKYEQVDNEASDGDVFTSIVEIDDVYQDVPIEECVEAHENEDIIAQIEGQDLSEDINIIVYENDEKADGEDGDDDDDYDDSVLQTYVNNEGYEDVEFLDEELEDNSGSMKAKNETEIPIPKDEDSQEVPRKRKWPKKLPIHERHKTYRQYTEESLRKCLDSVRSGEMTKQEAASFYRIPLKTVSSKLRAEETQEATPDPDREKSYKFSQEIKMILTYTNATPFKTKANKYYCGYCNTFGPAFSPEGLRVHTRTTHHDRTTKVDYMLRPPWTNEVLRMDIDNLVCHICCIVIEDWNNMFKHLKEVHSVLLDLAYSRVVPYVLNDDLKCALCKERFTSFIILDNHMNSHYNNYVCGDCGDTFLTLSRFKNHAKSHDIGSYPCKQCNRVFQFEKYLKKHMDSVHDMRAKFKCSHCPVKFRSEHLKHMHEVKEHKDKVKSITCELCAKEFTFKQYYTRHLVRKHSAKKKLYCADCGKGFLTESYLKEHRLRHTGERRHECYVCKKRFYSQQAVMRHMRRHK